MKKLFLLFILFVASSNPVFSQTWTQQTSPVTTDLNGAWAVNEQIVWMCGPADIVIRTTNSGTTWTLANNGLSGNDFYTISAIDANICVVGASDGGLWRTTNGGVNWTLINLSPPAVFFNVVHFFDLNLGFAQSDPTGGSWKYYITTNSGTTWSNGPVIIPASGTEAGWNNDYSALDTGRIFWGTNVNKVLRGSFRGPWTSTNTFLTGITFNDNLNGIAKHTSGEIYKTTDGGVNWINTGFNPVGTPLAMKGVQNTGYMWIGTSTNIYRSTNYGTNWINQYSLPLNTSIYALTFDYQRLGWAGTQGGKIFRYTDYDGIDPNNTSVPEKFILEQNYPNPFNPSTTIKYSLPKLSHVMLKIYDALGNLVKTVVNTNQAAGNYVEDVDMSSLASGIYLYTLSTEDFSTSRKMMLIK